ncbi:MAG: gephyrin-like molybdotransferase Glp [Candidatus Firestonebacteria bacterium]|mgnify:CR=1 FL=1
MIKFKEAQKIILKNVRQLSLEKINISFVLGRILGENIYSNINIPPFSKSAMDGFAIRYKDIVDLNGKNCVSLKIIADLPAGKTFKRELKIGEAVRIMTGAPVPSGADIVVPIEDVQVDGFYVRILKTYKQGTNIAPIGEDVQKGELVMEKGSLLGPAHIGMFAALGKKEVKLYKKPYVAILPTGSELVDISKSLTKGKIRDSNSYSLNAQVTEAGAAPVKFPICRDVEEKLTREVQKGLKYDVLIVSGGISVGDYDFVKRVFEKLKIKEIFWKVAIKPGMPVFFGKFKDKLVFGLPGNPVSVMVTYELFIRPALLLMMGRKDCFREEVSAVAKCEIKHKRGRLDFIRGNLNWQDGEYFVSPTGFQGSGVLKSMVQANSLIVIPENLDLIPAGTKVKVLKLK